MSSEEVHCDHQLSLYSPNQITEITSHMHEALPANTRSVDEHAVLVRVQPGTNVQGHNRSNLLMSAFNIDKTIRPHRSMGSHLCRKTKHPIQFFDAKMASRFCRLKQHQDGDVNFRFALRCTYTPSILFCRLIWLASLVGNVWSQSFRSILLDRSSFLSLLRYRVVQGNGVR